MSRSIVRLGAAAFLAAALAACADGGNTFVPEKSGGSNGNPPALVTIDCTGSIANRTVRCVAAKPDGPATDLIVGGQGTFVQLTSSNIAIEADTFGFDVTVQNLIGQALGTTDGVTLDPAGVRAFFANGPVVTAGTGSIEVANEDGEEVFMTDPAPYYQYDEVLAPNQTSAPKRWKLRFDPGVTGFGFRVLVAAEVQYPDGWVDLGTDADTVVATDTAQLSPVVRDVIGRPVSDPVTYGTSNGTVASVDGSGVVTGTGVGTATITATSGPRSGAVTISVCPNLAVGQAYTASMPVAASTCFAGGASGAAEYTYMPVNLSTSSALSLTVTGTGIQAVTGPPSPSLAPANGLRLAQATAGDAHAARLASEKATLASRMSGRGGLVRTAANRPRLAITPGVPAVNDLMSLNVAQGCSGTPDNRTGRVRTVSQHAIIISDTANPAGGFTTAQYDSIALEFDSLSYPVDSVNFGAPTDRDSNGRIVLFYTRAVNELSPPASSSLTYGYFTNRDVFSTDPVSGCERSNAGEILYMLVPDPTGAVNSNVRTVSAVRGNGSRTHAHELQHLINAFRRVYVTGATGFEEPWLDEGLSQVAEELMFYRTSVGLAPRQNIVLSNLNTGPNASRRVAAYNTYQNNNFTLFRGWLQRPDTTGAFKTGAISSSFRGVNWAFLRYASDRVNGSDAAFWQSLVNSNLEGKANLQNAIGADPNLWYRDFVAAMYADDNSFSVAAELRTPSWNYRSVYGGLGGFPLGTRALANGTPLTLSYSYGGGTMYGRFGVAQSAFAGVTALSGGSVPTSPFQLIVVRTK